MQFVPDQGRDVQPDLGPVQAMFGPLAAVVHSDRETAAKRQDHLFFFPVGMNPAECIGEQIVQIVETLRSEGQSSGPLRDCESATLIAKTWESDQARF